MRQCLYNFFIGNYTKDYNSSKYSKCAITVPMWL